MLINKSDKEKSFLLENGEHHRKQGPQSSQVKKKKNCRPSELKIYFYCCAGIFPYTVFPWVMLAVENKT